MSDSHAILTTLGLLALPPAGHAGFPITRLLAADLAEQFNDASTDPTQFLILIVISPSNSRVAATRLRQHHPKLLGRRPLIRRPPCQINDIS